MFNFIKQTTVLFASGAVMIGTFPKTALAATFNLEKATVADINAVFDAGALTSEQLTQLYLNRIDAYDNNGPIINSFLTINPNALETAAALDKERQLTGSRSPMHGIPVLLTKWLKCIDRQSNSCISPPFVEKATDSIGLFSRGRNDSLSSFAVENVLLRRRRGAIRRSYVA